MKNYYIEVNNILNSSLRPVVLLGDTISHLLNIPPLPVVVAATESLHLVHTNHKFFIGKYGKTGDRAGNMAVQNSDLLLIIGGVDIETRKEWFAREAHIITVSDPPVQSDYFLSMVFVCDIHPDVFLKEWVIQHNPSWNDWIFQCRQWKSKWLFETPPPSNPSQPSLDLYIFHALLQQHYHKLCHSIVARQDNWFWCPLYQQMLVDEHPRHLYRVRHNNILEQAYTYIENNNNNNPILVFLPHKYTIHPKDIIRLNRDEPPFIIFLINVEKQNKFQINNDGYYDLAAEGVLLEKTTKTPFIHIHIDNIYDVLDTLHEVKKPIFVWVECGTFSPYPIGIPDRPPEEMTPNVEDMMNDMIIPPIID